LNNEHRLKAQEYQSQRGLKSTAEVLHK